MLLPTTGKKEVLPEVMLAPRAYAECLNPRLDHGCMSGVVVGNLGKKAGGWSGSIPFLGWNMKDLWQDVRNSRTVDWAGTATELNVTVNRRGRYGCWNGAV